MRLRDGGNRKGGAEGLFCAAAPEAADRTEGQDGASRAIGPAVALVLGIDEDCEASP